ncbi:MAG: VPLPA-CTERM sorting domain-containing protein [Pseudomonadota bacterium]
MTLSALRTMIAVAAIGAASVASASTVPPVNDPNGYVGNYDISNAEPTSGSHGLWLPSLFDSQPNDRHWSVTSGTANYDGSSMVMTGNITNTVGGTNYEMTFDFQVFQTNVEPAAPYCGRAACSNPPQANVDNMVYFDMGGRTSMGSIVGVGLLDGLVLDIAMKPLNFPTNYKPGQLGFGGNWFNLEFGYSNWLDWSVRSNTTGINFRSSGGGDINFDFTENGNPPNNNPNPVPLPAGLPLLLAGLGAFAWMRRRQAA